MKTCLLCLLLTLKCAAVDKEYKIDLVAAVLVLEADCQGPIGMAAVLEVARNRAKNGDIYAEMVKPRQFSCLNGISNIQAINKAKRSPNFQIARKIVIENKKTCLTANSDHYCSRPFPYWTKDQKVRVKIGKHHFYKLLK